MALPANAGAVTVAGAGAVGCCCSSSSCLPFCGGINLDYKSYLVRKLFASFRPVFCGLVGVVVVVAAADIALLFFGIFYCF